MARPTVFPNPKSRLLAQAHVGGAGITLPVSGEIPAGMAAILLFVPASEVVGKNPGELQDDLGLPWFCTDGSGFWFNEWPGDEHTADG